MSDADIQKLQSLQSVGKSQSSETGAFILRNDLQAAWERVSSLKDARIDLVLDNGMFVLSRYICVEHRRNAVAGCLGVPSWF